MGFSMFALIQKAKETIEKYFDRSRHTVASAVRTKNGDVFTSVSVKGQKLDLCSEWSAVVQALMSGSEIEIAVAVHRDTDGNYEIYPPCGLCRELYLTYCPNAQIVLSEVESVQAETLLPKAWTRKK